MAYLLAIAGGSRGSRFYTSALEQTDVVDNSADQGEAKAMQGIGERPGKHYQEEDAAISYDLASDRALRRQDCFKARYVKAGHKTYLECKSGCCCQGHQKKVTVKKNVTVCERCARVPRCQSG